MRLLSKDDLRPSANIGKEVAGDKQWSRYLGQADGRDDVG